MSENINRLDGIVYKLANKSDKLSATVRALEHSLEFSQNEVDKLKAENAKLKQTLGLIEMEDRRTQFQVKSAEDKIDRLETLTKKKNLSIEGLPEVEGGREDVERSVCDLLDHLTVNKRINFDACYRIGPYNKNKTRPIMVCFEKQADRDLIYSKRMDLKKTANHQKVWINEDLGALSKRKKNIMRLISREAQLQGIDCRTGKYSMLIDKVRYDGDNLDELPPQVHPTSLKQVQIDEQTLAYQSEFAPFSNFFPCDLIIGGRRFFCLEQAYQFMRAKTLNRPLIATKIFLSRDVRYIKQVGGELGTSPEWEAKMFDVMYECLKKKFEQNPVLKALLVKTGDLLLVEATPDRLWGCGATLSSNVIRKRQWPGKNKHGEILMTVRDEFRLLEIN